MLQMKRNTRAKIVSLAASALTLGAVFGLVRRDAPQTAAAQPALVAAPAVAQQGSAATTSAQAQASQPAASQTRPALTVHTTTRVS